MASFLYFFFFFFFFSVITFSLFNAAFSTITLPLRKDPRTRQYYTQLQMSTNTTLVNVVIDLAGQNTWFSCDNYNSPSYRPVPCESNLCNTFGGIGGCVGCNGPLGPDCNNDTCGSNDYNPYRNLLYGEGYISDRLTTRSTDGKLLLANYAFSCAAPELQRNLARQTIGMIGLTRATSSLPSQLWQALNLPKKFVLCIPSSTGVGDIFIGGGPYAAALTTTPLLINPNSTAPAYTVGDPSDEYFIGVRSIRIDGRAVSINNTLLSFSRDGYGGTKLSTIARYTTLEDSIYRAFARAYVSAAASKRIVRVGPVRPFGVCFNSNAANGSAPNVDLVLQSESVRWRFTEPNLMVRINSTVSCLAVVNGGLNPRTAIVIGGHQLENYVVEFDLVSSRLGFSSSLLGMNTSCSR